MKPKLYYFSLCFFLLPFSFLAQNYSCQHMKNAALTPSLYYSPDNKRSDTFDVLKYTINIEVGTAANKFIKGNTQIRFAPKINGRSYIRFDLLKLIVDSVKENNTILSYTYNDTILKVNFAALKNTSDTSTITVYYNGLPQPDLQWGGFYFDNNGGADYAYNLGVGFKAKPHNFGRVWFPCFDNFIERSKYEFNITSDTARKAYCNGALVSDLVSGSKRTRKWVMNEEIPTYLASVAVAKYRQVTWTANTLSGPKPVYLVAAAADTTALKTGFVNLLNCIAGYENRYGNYRWNRFGYCVVPFSSGAMEHATNIAYPKPFIGNVGYEAVLMAHELSHHWWGDNITCETQEDMWINEGMASFSEYIFKEWQYGPSQYTPAMKNMHEDLLHFLHKKEGGFRAVSGIPHSLTYGDHVYKKGALVGYNLRYYMGDAAFFNAVKYVMQQNQFKSINSLEFRDLLQAGSGQNLQSFFNNWVLAGGWPHFAIDSVKYVQIGANNYNAVVSLKQKLYGAPSLHSNVPLQLSFFKSDWSRVVQTVTMSGSSATFTVNIPYAAVYCALNYDNKLFDATSFEVKVVKTASNLNWNLGKLYTPVQSAGAPDSSLIRVIHNYVKPDPFKNNPQNHKLSDQHYWKVEGILAPGFKAKVRLNYDGNKSLGGTFAYLDTMLCAVNADSIAVFYRKDAADDWKWLKNGTYFQIDNKSGFIEFDTLKLGEYTFGNLGDTSAVGMKTHQVSKLKAELFPNPASSFFQLRLPEKPADLYTVSILSVDGKLAEQFTLKEKQVKYDTSRYPKGAYLVTIEDKGKLLFCEKLILE